MISYDEEALEYCSKTTDTILGGTLGMYCSHAYAHATEEGSEALPAVLKGSDFMAYEVFRSLGIKTLIRPVLDTASDEEDDSEAEYDFEDLDEDDDQEDLELARIGEELSEPVMSNKGGSECDCWSEIWPGYRHERVEVQWLNRTTASNMQFGFLKVSSLTHAVLKLC